MAKSKHSGTKALYGKDLQVGANYEVIISLDDYGKDANTQVRSFTFTTPKFLPRLSLYSTESNVSKSIRSDIKTTPEIITPAFTIYREFTRNVTNISVDLGDAGTEAWTGGKVSVSFRLPTATDDKSLCKITLTFDTPLNKDDKKYFTNLTNVGNSMSDIFTDLSDARINGSGQMVIKRTWAELDPSIPDELSSWFYKGPADLTGPKRLTKYGFWSSDTWKVLHELATTKHLKANNYWKSGIGTGALKWSTEHPVPKKDIKGTSTTTYAVDSVLNSSIPPGVAAHTIDDYNNDTVDYFYFFVNQEKTGSVANDGKWWYFDNTLTTITPAAIGGRIRGNQGYITIKNGVIDYGKTPKKPVDKVTNNQTEIAISRLQARSTTAACNLFSGTATPHSGKFIDANFPIMPVNVRFAVVRYTKKNGVWSGKWIPSFSTTPDKQEVKDILSNVEVIGAV